MKQRWRIIGSTVGGLVLLALGGVAWGQVDQISLPSLSNLTQTLSSSTIVSEDGDAVITLSVRDGIQIPTGSFRDGSILPEDIAGLVDEIYSLEQCAEGQILVGMDENGKQCATLTQPTRRQSIDGGRSIYYTNTGNKQSAVLVNFHATDIDGRSDRGVWIKGKTSIEDALAINDGVTIAAGGSSAPSVGLGEVRADGAGAPTIMHGGMTLLPLADLSDPRDIIVGTMTDPYEPTDELRRVSVDGDVSVDGGVYLRGSQGSDRSVTALNQLSRGSWITANAKSNNTYKDSIIARQTPGLVIGGQSSTADVSSSSQLSVEGDISIDSDRRGLHLAGMSTESGTAGTVDATSTIPDECVALSLDSQGEIVLVNVCAGYDATTPVTPVAGVCGTSWPTRFDQWNIDISDFCLEGRYDSTQTSFSDVSGGYRSERVCRGIGGGDDTTCRHKVSVNIEPDPPTQGSIGSYITCFVGDTMVTLADGSLIPIQDVQLGDVLRGATSDNTVLGFHQPVLGDKLLYSFNGGDYFVTAEHPFMTVDGWKAIDPDLAQREHRLNISIGQLGVGDTLITDDGEVFLSTIDARTADPDTKLYNFILDGDHTYYADGYLVHNKYHCNVDNTCGDGSRCVDTRGIELLPEDPPGACRRNCVDDLEIKTGMWGSDFVICYEGFRHSYLNLNPIQ